MKSGRGIFKQFQHLCSASWLKFARLWKSFCFLFTRFYRSVLLRVNSFCIQVCYFVTLSVIGFWILKAMKPRTLSPRNIDLFFTSVSAATVSSMSTVEMEVFSNPQLIILTVLMFIGGEIFTSMVGLHLRTSILKQQLKTEDNRAPSDILPPRPSTPQNVIVVFDDQIELGVLSRPESKASQIEEAEIYGPVESFDFERLRFSSVRLLGFLVLAYLLAVQVVGISMVLVYFSVASSARNVLKSKGLRMLTFSIFTVVSTFGSCGFVPTNENMTVFRKNSGLLMILIPQVLLGNTLFPPALRSCIWVLEKLDFKKMKMEVNYLLKSTSEIGYLHLLPPRHSSFLVITALGFILIQFVLFCSMEWSSISLNELSSYEKLVGALFQCVNARHTGETSVDLSTVAPAIAVLFVVMMYLPPYTSFLPVRSEEEHGHVGKRRKLLKRGRILDTVIFSQLSYLAMLIILICITEREKMKNDPINFAVFNIVFEVVSAYGNVGFTMGYSCKRQLTPVEGCEDKWYGFSGKWSDKGKIILMIVMLFGRLKKFNMNGGRAWKLL